jgi:hypothetical protein
VALAVLIALLLPASAAAAPPDVKLNLSVSDGAGATRTASLRCGDQTKATGFLKRAPVRHCRRARKLSSLLTGAPPLNAICTQIYGGPQTAAVTGRIGAQRVERRFARTDGCEIDDWNRMGSLLG